MIEDPPPHDRATVTNNSSESTDRSERVPAVILSLLPLFLFHSVRPFLASSRHDHVLSLSRPQRSVPLSFRTRRKEGTPFLEWNVHNRSDFAAVSIEMLVPVFPTLSIVPLLPPSIPPSFFFVSLQSTRAHAGEDTRKSL